MSTLAFDLEVNEREQALRYLKAENVLSQLGNAFRTIFAQHGENNVFYRKEDGTITSQFEQNIEILIGKLLQKLTPWAHFTGEEGTEYRADRSSSLFRWLVDPIDGSISFSRGLDTFSFVATLLEDQIAIASVVLFPSLGREYHAYKDQGLFLNDTRVFMRHPPDVQDIIIAVSDDETFELVKRNSLIQKVRSLNCRVRTYTDLYGHSMVAHGGCSLKIDAACARWDRMPAELLVQEAGGKTLFLPIADSTEALEGSLIVYHPSLENLVFNIAETIGEIGIS